MSSNVNASEIKRDFRQEVTNDIIRMLEAGTAPWQRPWEQQADIAMPFNPTTGKPYRGGNVLALMMTAMRKGYTDSRWCTYKQASDNQWQVRKGEKGTQIEFWDVRKPSDKDADQEGDDKGRPRLIHRVYTVFNGQQIDGMPTIEIKPRSSFEVCEAGENILTGSGANIRYGGNRAYFSRATDHIQLPERHSFPTAEGFYGTAAHELIHWTGAEKRLNRPTLVQSRSFGDESYAKEELVAEIGSWMTALQTGIPHNPEQNAAYVASWLKALKDDKNEIFRAASAASAATDYLLSPDKSRAAEQDESQAEGPHTARAVASQRQSRWR